MTSISIRLNVEVHHGGRHDECRRLLRSPRQSIVDNRHEGDGDQGHNHGIHGSASHRKPSSCAKGYRATQTPTPSTTAAALNALVPGWIEIASPIASIATTVTWRFGRGGSRPAYPCGTVYHGRRLQRETPTVDPSSMGVKANRRFGQTVGLPVIESTADQRPHWSSCTPLAHG